MSTYQDSYQPAPPVVREHSPRGYRSTSRRQYDRLGLYIALGLVARATILTVGGYLIYRLEMNRVFGNFEQAMEEAAEELNRSVEQMTREMNRR